MIEDLEILSSNGMVKFVDDVCVSPEDLIKFYVACIRSVLLYACQVYHYNLPEYLSKSLEQIQKRAMKIIYGYDTSYNSALEQAGYTY